MTELHVLRVFIGPDGRGGNPLGVFLDGAAIAPDRRQAVAAKLGYSETVFVDDIDEGTGIAVVRIFTPAAEIPFAGHPTVGTSWLLASLGRHIDTRRCPAGDVATWTDTEGRRWVRARASWIHAFVADRLASVADVEAATPPSMGTPGRYVWAWEDEMAGRLRARYFPTDYGILEDEATGAAAVRMGHDLGRPITIRQGVGSELLVRPDPNPASDAVEVGGRVELVEMLAFGQ